MGGIGGEGERGRGGGGEWGRGGTLLGEEFVDLFFGGVEGSRLRV